jgi:hypothetical protein
MEDFQSILKMAEESVLQGAMFYALAGLVGVGVVTLLLLAAEVDVAIRCGALPAVGG